MEGHRRCNFSTKRLLLRNEVQDQELRDVPLLLVASVVSPLLVSTLDRDDADERTIQFLRSQRDVRIGDKGCPGIYAIVVESPDEGLPCRERAMVAVGMTANLWSRGSTHMRNMRRAMEDDWEDPRANRSCKFVHRHRGTRGLSYRVVLLAAFPEIDYYAETPETRIMIRASLIMMGSTFMTIIKTLDFKTKTQKNSTY